MSKADSKRRDDVWSNQEIEDAETEQIERDADVTKVVETRQHANAKAAKQPSYDRWTIYSSNADLAGQRRTQTDEMACFSARQMHH